MREQNEQNRSKKVKFKISPVNLTLEGSLVLPTKVTLVPVSRKCGSHLGERRHTLLQHLHAVPLYRYGPLTHSDVSEGLYVESPTRPEDHFPDLIRPFKGFM